METLYTPASTPVWFFSRAHRGTPRETWGGASLEGCRTGLVVAERRKGGVGVYHEVLATVGAFV